MRDIFEDIFHNQPLDPTEAARRSMRPQLRRRFYQAVGLDKQPGGYRGPARWPSGPHSRTPSAWRRRSSPWRRRWPTNGSAQREVVDPAAMPLTRLANSIIDGVADTVEAVQAEVAKFLGLRPDLLSRRHPGRLGRAPDAALGPAGRLGARRARRALGARRRRDVRAAAGRRARGRGARHSVDPWRLGAVHAITTLTGSALIALALAQGATRRPIAWAAAHVDEDWNMLAVGPGRAGAGTPRRPRGRNAGGGDGAGVAEPLTARR